ncbi:hypothetical protein ALC60_07058 [Trachymyrmex zeteki]|uniref:Uncharacterized protein n=1 Tax=Mycetomoellerius zeteki TaxID=64791 RepID=A0A151X0W0_9HYME|nr:hypothetical protein ALC60_07058 [Trachymyrmex zeteki]
MSSSLHADRCAVLVDGKVRSKERVYTRSIDERDGRRSEEKSYRLEWEDRRRNDKQKALDSSPKRSLLAASAPRNVAPKIRVFAVGLLVDAFVQPSRYPRRRARAERRSGIAMAPISSRIREVISRDKPRKNGNRV